MFGHKNWVSNLDTSKKSKARLANDNIIEAVGIGDIQIKKDGKVMAVIEIVLYVPGMKCNLFSVGKLVEKGFSVCMKDDILKVYDSK